MARRYKGTIYVHVSEEVDVPLEDVLEQISDEELLKELTDRKLEEKAKARMKVSDTTELLEEVADAVREGDTKEALLLLERIMRPKFSSLELCEKEFQARRAQTTGQQT